MIAKFTAKCDRRPQCTDATDEIGCSCEEHRGEVACDCITDGTCTSFEGCLKIRTLVQGFVRCPDKRIFWGSSGRVMLHRLRDISECNDMGFPRCDNSTCYESNFTVCVDGKCFESSVICTSLCDDEDCKKVFQCSDNQLIFHSQFCDGIVDCFDGSDEITNQAGFKCAKCVLPQNNLYDNLAHCDNNTDFCFTNKNACFQCLDKRLLILPGQVCDGVNDCYDMSDECLCEQYFDSAMCKSKFEGKAFQCFDNDNQMPWHDLFDKSDLKVVYDNKNPFIECPTKFHVSSIAIKCDGRPECKDYRDECECFNPPLFCNDSCHSFFLMGDRYCDGVEDPAWQYINIPSCPRGFDELFCPKRFKCKASGNVSVDIQQVCDRNIDCDDASDEKGCFGALKNQSIFSSDTNMIANLVIKSAFWVMGFVVIIGNIYVIISTAVGLIKNQAGDSLRFHQVIILNISIADFIMGIYLLTIAAHDALFSGVYGNVDYEWRSSLKCSIIGSLAVLSSETSCFLMVILTAFRLKNVTKALKSLSFSMRPWKFFVGMAWLFSFALSTVPMSSLTLQYFLHSFSYTSAFRNGDWDINKLKPFACRYAALTNISIKFMDNDFRSVMVFCENALSDKLSFKFFGYYGETSVCMPRFYVAYGEKSWEFTLSIITLNFLCFLFIAVSYYMIYIHSTRSSAALRNNRTQNRFNKMQKRIARIIATDFLCWVPICIMAYVRLVVEFSDIVYQISAVFLLPINSAMNPFLFSSLPDKLMEACRRKYQNFKQMCGG